MTISTSGELGLLQMVLEPGFTWCGVRTLGLQRRWIVRSHIDWGGEQNIPYKGVETSP